MYEFDIMYEGHEHIVFGYSLKDACKRFGCDASKVKVLYRTYVD